MTLSVAEVSPSGLYRSASMDLAGVGVTDDTRFIEALIQFKAAWGEYAAKRDAEILAAIEREIRESRGRSVLIPEEKSGPTEDLVAPEFEFNPRSASERIGSAAQKMGTMLIETLGLLLIGWFRFRRQEFIVGSV